jgi:hypothetical protein
LISTERILLFSPAVEPCTAGPKPPPEHLSKFALRTGDTGWTRAIKRPHTEAAFSFGYGHQVARPGFTSLPRRAAHPLAPGARLICATSVLTWTGWAIPAHLGRHACPKRCRRTSHSARWSLSLRNNCSSLYTGCAAETRHLICQCDVIRRS